MSNRNQVLPVQAQPGGYNNQYGNPQQPGAAPVVLIAPQAQTIKRGKESYTEEWLSPFCGCFSSEYCAMAWCCFACLYCQLGQHYRDNCCEASYCTNLFLYRSIFRHKKKIAGSHCMDLQAAIWCPVCTITQLMEEHKKRNDIYNDDPTVTKVYYQ